MTPIDFLTRDIEYFHLHAPAFAWYAAFVFLAWPVSEIGRLSWQTLRQKRELEKVTRATEKLRSGPGSSPRSGLSVPTLGEMEQIFARSRFLRSPWSAYVALLVVRRNETGEDQLWASGSAENVFTDEAVFDEGMNRSYFRALPSTVTGAGLFITFLAILFALKDVHISAGRVMGMSTLIGGLSGKFVSSVAALFSATLFLLFEKPLLHRLSRSRMRLVSSIDALVPRLSPALLLVDIQRDIAEQSVAFRSFNADLSTKFKQGFSESLGPTIQRMVETIEEMNRQLRAAEAQKQESITGSVATLLQSLEQSISSSLAQMGDSFKESLSGTATAEFAHVTESLGGAARLLENMNGQFQSTQAVLAELVGLAKSSTVEQLALGKSQVEDLTAVLRQFMVQMNETAGSSVTRMASTMTSAVSDLTNKVNALGEQMTAAMKSNAAQTSAAAADVIANADQWSSRSTEKLEQVIQQLEGHTKGITEAEGALMKALELFNNSLGQYASLNAGLNKIAGEVSAMSVAASGAAHSVADSQKTLQQIAAQATSQLERLADANKRQQEVWTGIYSSMETYKNAFNQTERAAKDLLSQIAQHVDSHLEVTRRGYSEIVKTADDFIGEAARRLGASVNELDEHLQDLSETIGSFKERSDGHRA